MIKRLECIINLCYYYNFATIRAVNMFFNNLVLKPLYGSRFVKQRASHFGIEDPYNNMVRMENSPENGVVITVSYILFFGWMIGLLLSLSIILNKITSNYFYSSVFSSKLYVALSFMLTLTIPYLILKSFVLSNRRYLIYFRYFESRDKIEKDLNKNISVIIFLLTLGVILFAFIVLLL